MNAIWFLIFSFASDGGVVTIPQASQADCYKQMAYINEHRFDSNGPRWAYCAYGVR